MSQDLIDPAVFEELQDAMGHEFAAELLDTFLGDAANMFAQLEQAASDQDADGYRRAAHSLKSNAQTFGAALLSIQARDMELSGNIDAVAISALRDTFDTTAKALELLKDG